MISKNEAKKMYDEYHEEKERERLLAIEQKKVDTLAWCNDGLSEDIKLGASAGDRRTFIYTVNTARTSECVSQVVPKGYCSYGYHKVRELHMPTLIQYVTSHGFKMTSKEERYNFGESYYAKDEKMHDGITYAIEWA